MFMYVAQTTLLFLSVYFPLIISFVFAFYLLIPSNSAFSNPLNALFKVLAMMLGEFDYEDHFTLDESKEGTDWSIGSLQIIFILFLVLVSIIVQNLIIGLTVSEIETLFKKAKSIQLEQLVREVIDFK